jgi:hypothetical protein
VEPRRVSLGGLEVVFRLTGEETGGALAVGHVLVPEWIEELERRHACASADRR